MPMEVEHVVAWCANRGAPSANFSAGAHRHDQTGRKEGEGGREREPRAGSPRVSYRFVIARTYISVHVRRPESGHPKICRSSALDGWIRGFSLLQTSAREIGRWTTSCMEKFAHTWKPGDDPAVGMSVTLTAGSATRNASRASQDEEGTALEPFWDLGKPHARMPQIPSCRPGALWCYGEFEMPKNHTMGED
jgi:hypothetical protein